MLSVVNRQHSWAVVLAGGDGTRLQTLTRLISGDERPKQFCPVFGGKSLLGHTLERLGPLFRRDRTACVVTQGHQRFYRDEIEEDDPVRSMVQPMNRGTGVAVAAALLQILRLDPEAIVAFFPSDHYYAHNHAFATAVESALRMATEYPHSLILMGAEADYPEIEYGWIEPGRVMMESPGTRLQRVKRFWEKPMLRRARILLRRGCLWNTFVTIGWARAFLELLQGIIPQTLRSLEWAGVGAGDLGRAYQQVSPVDLSREVLAAQPQRLLVLRDAASGWADFGTPGRVISTLVRDGIEPPWLGQLRRRDADSQWTIPHRMIARP
jgi:mannose-1-phosphate guanylyltransferase